MGRRYFLVPWLLPVRASRPVSVPWLALPPGASSLRHMHTAAATAMQSSIFTSILCLVQHCNHMTGPHHLHRRPEH